MGVRHEINNRLLRSIICVLRFELSLLDSALHLTNCLSACLDPDPWCLEPFGWFVSDLTVDVTAS